MGEIWELKKMQAHLDRKKDERRLWTERGTHQRKK